MWLATKYGFFSVVKGKVDFDGKFGGKIDQGTVMVRARNRDHLVNLIREGFTPEPITEDDILELPARDYRFRLVIPCAAWEAMSSALMRDIDYGNFKDEAKRAGLVDEAYLSRLTRIWSIMHDMQLAKYGYGSRWDDDEYPLFEGSEDEREVPFWEPGDLWSEEEGPGDRPQRRRHKGRKGKRRNNARRKR